MQQIHVNPIKTLLVAVALSFTFSVIAQEKSTPLEQVMEGLTVRNIGPAGMSGRVTCIAAHPLKATTLYAGSASGGLVLETVGISGFYMSLAVPLAIAAAALLLVRPVKSAVAS